MIGFDQGDVCVVKEKGSHKVLGTFIVPEKLCSKMLARVVVMRFNRTRDQVYFTKQ